MDLRPARGVDARLHDFFAELPRSFARAAARTGRQSERTYRVAGQAFTVGIAGGALEPVLTPAFAHLPPAEAGGGWHIRAWDEAESGVPMPRPTWPWPEHGSLKHLVLPGAGEGFRISIEPDPGIIALCRGETGEAWFWSRDAKRLPTNQYGSPLLGVMHWWAQARGLCLVHAAGVGTEDGGVLLVGKGGSGKSTTALSCLQAGFEYVGDDYCLVSPGEKPEAFGLYSSGKLFREQFPRFPELAARAIDPGPDVFRKPVVFLYPDAARHLPECLPLRAIVIPTITGGTESECVPVGAAEAFRAIAPSTTAQLVHDESTLIQGMLALVRRLPCFQLRLGTRLTGAPLALRSLLHGLSP
jgi:hypothetical protein